MGEQTVERTDGRWKTVSVWSLTLGREVLASALATGLATLAFTAPSHRDAPVPGGAFGPTGKLVERLGQDGVEPMRQALRLYDTVALFGMPVPDAAPFATAAAEPPPDTAGRTRANALRARLAASRSQPATTAQDAGREPAEEPARRTTLAVTLPPERPRPEAARVEPPRGAAPQIVAAAAGSVAPRRIELLGWRVPGSEYIPTGAEAVGRLASLGEGMSAVGASIAGNVGLR